ncbi:hypothetical protein GO495_05545 [Chitinophaga oryziterrae]|uniref:Uncharacterized protein n=1 Tax=Chitinophaga oryziterrae TaxID=1031224 RepID=A0A6N8J492_9BACT|nr:hypothetical protein [Chitinophaga oryziterrae]MVT40037.1 hypothetical protein [Chitinophaga oryziterrae]
MARADNNLFMSNLSGTIGNQMTIRHRGGSTIVSKKQKKSKKRSTEAQLEVQEKFSGAILYANKVMLDPDLKALYKAVALPGQNAHNMAVRDARNPPEIKSVITDNYTGNAGDQIVVRAIDVFRVFQVVVAIYTAAGALLEQGNAVMGRNSIDWTYTATKKNTALKGGKIVAMAEDLPGNQTYSEISM